MLEPGSHTHPDGASRFCSNVKLVAVVHVHIPRKSLRLKRVKVSSNGPLISCAVNMHLSSITLHLPSLSANEHHLEVQPALRPPIIEAGCVNASPELFESAPRTMIHVLLITSHHLHISPSYIQSQNGCPGA